MASRETSNRPDGEGLSVMTTDLSGSGSSGPQARDAPLYTFCPQRQGCYILMPQSLSEHKNTIGLTDFPAASGLRQMSAILRLTHINQAHISAAPTANGAYPNVARNCGEGFCDPKGYPCQGLGCRI